MYSGINTGIVISVFLGKFLLPHEVNLPESFLYVSLALIIAGYWSFQSYLRLLDKERVLKPDDKKIKEDLDVALAELRHSDEELQKQASALYTKINAILLQSGFKL